LLEDDDGRTFAFTEEIALFLEGFGSARQLVHFGFIFTQGLPWSRAAYTIHPSAIVALA